jgi:hypothetical protein
MDVMGEVKIYIGEYREEIIVSTANHSNHF